MAEQNTHINYSAEDIERYLTGKMSAKEMHDMEKAALQDPFLADAIEGFSNTSFEESKKHLNEITAALQTEKEETKVVPLATRSFYWLKVAAMIILVVGIGLISWFIFTTTNSPNKIEVAQIKENKKLDTNTVVTQSMNEVAKNDTTHKLVAQNQSATAYKKENRKDNLQKREKAITSAPAKTSSSQATLKKVSSDSLSIEDNVSAGITSSAETRQDTLQFRRQAFAQNKNLFTDTELKTFNGRVVDNNNHPVAYATIRANDKMVTTDTNGYFKLQSSDSSLHVYISSVGFVPASAQLKSYTANNISIQPNSTALNDVVVTKLGAKKKQREKVSNADSAYPSGGWESFQAYVYKKLNKPFDSTRSPEITGDVQLEFSIDENGEPYNFSVLRSANDASTSKAIEIIKSGPKWIATSKEKKGKVTIQF